MDLEKSIGRNSVVESFLERFKNALLRGEIKPGDQLPTEKEFSQKLGIGRSSLREAMKMLEVLGVVEIRRGDGTYVVEEVNSNSLNPLVFSLLLKSGTTRELVELRYIIEVGYTKIAAEKMTEEDLGEIRRVVSDHKEAIEEEEENLGQYENKFHRLILEATHNPFIIEIGKTVFKLFEHSIQKTSEMVPNLATRHHELILDALEEGSSDQVEDAIYESFEVWRDHVRD